MGKPVKITLPWPEPALWENRNAHWWVKADAKKKARSIACMLTKSAVRGWLSDVDATGFDLKFAFHLPKRGGRRPDLQNMPATQKAAIDGIADALNVDDGVFRVDYPTEWSEPVKGGRVTVEISPISLAAERASLGEG